MGRRRPVDFCIPGPEDEMFEDFNSSSNFNTFFCNLTTDTHFFSRSVVLVVIGRGIILINLFDNSSQSISRLCKYSIIELCRDVL